MKPALCFWLVLYSIIHVCLSSGKNDKSVRVCVAGNPNQKNSHITKTCEQLAAGSNKSPVTCVYGQDRLSCIQLVNDRKADFTLLEAEDLIFAASEFCSGMCNLQVVSEVRDENKQKYKYQTVVVVRTTKRVRSDLRGVRLCHPGWTLRDDRGGFFTQYLEERLAPQSCNSNLTLFEDRLQASAQYFGPSCKPGIWSADKEEDKTWKKKYSNLCAACDNPQECSTQDKYWGDGGAATCLRDGRGDAMWATYDDVRLHLKEEEDMRNFQFLCLDESMQSLNTEDPCPWLARPWQVVVAHVKVSDAIQKLLGNLSDDKDSDWEITLRNLLETHKEYIVPVEKKPPEDYIDTIPGFRGASEMASPNCNPPRILTWCTTTSHEYKKCRWIAKATMAFAIAPKISCIQLPNMTQCFKSADIMDSDIVVVPPDFQPEAMLHHNLKPIYYEETKSNDPGFNLVAVTKSSSPIKSVADLQSKKVCFTQHDGIASSAAIVALRATGLISKACSSANVLHNFFAQDSCVVAPHGDHAVCCGGTKEKDLDKAALKCLAQNGCDVAFISNRTLQKTIKGINSEPWAARLRTTDFRFIARDKEGTSYSWATAAPNAFMAAANLPEVQKREVKHVLSQISRVFLRKTKSSMIASTIFGPFEDENDVIFQDSSVDFKPENRYKIQFSLEKIVKEIRLCSKAAKLMRVSNLSILMFLFFAQLLW